MSRSLLCDLKTFDKYVIIDSEVPVAQWIEHRSPEPGAQVRFLSGTLNRSTRFRSQKAHMRAAQNSPHVGHFLPYPGAQNGLATHQNLFLLLSNHRYYHFLIFLPFNRSKVDTAENLS